MIIKGTNCKHKSITKDNENPKRRNAERAKGNRTKDKSRNERESKQRLTKKEEEKGPSFKDLTLERRKKKEIKIHCNKNAQDDDKGL